jgi:hypothetical protein
VNGKVWTLGGFLLLLGGLATNGPGIITALQGAWLFAVKISDTAPLGLASAALTFIACVGLQGLLGRWVPLAWHNPEMRDFLIQSATLGVSVSALMYQLPPQSRVQAILLGLIVGTFAPYCWVGLVGLWKLVARSTGITEDKR